ncbi:hypothetical protein ACXWTF_12660 [Thiomicrolovo sp. ZZH C-3]
MTPTEYMEKETRLGQIEQKLKQMSDEDRIDMVAVLELREEARAIVIDMRKFLDENFKNLQQ